MLEPVTYDGPRFDSVGLNYLLHRMPGDIRSKAVVFDHLIALGCFGRGRRLRRDLHRTCLIPSCGQQATKGPMPEPTSAANLHQGKVCACHR